MPLTEHRKAIQAAWRSRNRLRENERQRLWRQTEAGKAYYKEYGPRYRARHPEKFSEYNLRAQLKQYGITIEDYHAQLESQGNCCAICGVDRELNGKRQRFSVDHDHKTGKFRGLICNDCNLLIGKAKDEVGILEVAIEYLKNA